MNTYAIRYILGYVLKIEAILMLLPCITSLCYQEKEGLVYLVVAVVTFLTGALIGRKKPKEFLFYLKDGCVTTALSWILMSIFGSLPFIITGEIPHFIDALFETISGFTTTGASILNDVEALSHTSLIWRSFTHWIGGMGVLVFLLAIIPLSGGSNINLMRAESPGPSVGKLYPKVRNTARILYLIYIAMTLTQFFLLILGRMPVFDAICTSFGTAGTGGFGVKNDSLTSYSPYLQWVTAIFMMLFAINFNAYYFLTIKQIKKGLTLEEVRFFILLVLLAAIFITINILPMYPDIFTAMRDSFFQVTSLVSSTGFSSANFDLWPHASKTVLILLMCMGACAGSTGGGIKVSRFLILLKTVLKEFNSYIHPKSVIKIKMDKKPIEHDVVRSTNVYFITFIIILSLSVFFISLEEKDLVTNFTAVLATLNNIGPGLSLVGPTANFSHFSIFSKIVLMFDMIAGRLELFPILILFHPALWKDYYTTKRTAYRRKHKRAD